MKPFLKVIGPLTSLLGEYQNGWGEFEAFFLLLGRELSFRQYAESDRKPLLVASRGMGIYNLLKKLVVPSCVFTVALITFSQYGFYKFTGGASCAIDS